MSRLLVEVEAIDLEFLRELADSLGVPNGQALRRRVFRRGMGALMLSRHVGPAARLRGKVVERWLRRMVK